MQKRYITRITRVGSGIGLIIPAQFARELDIRRGEYYEYFFEGGKNFSCSRIDVPKPALASEK